ncbi:MAG: aldehyde dehydrogenase family protein, partial [Arenicellales bacterium]|nr:aldehyde dehydrogenase family protein [Arenicellales bacterium]
MSATIGHFIDGVALDGNSGRYGDVYNPSTGEVVHKVALATADETCEAIRSASEALPAWAATPPAKRAQVLFSFRNLLISHLDELAGLLSLEHGKTIDDAKGSLTRGLEIVEFACGAPQLLKGQYSEMVASGVDSYAIRQPVGVCAGITPFNFPGMVPMWM